MRAVMRKYGNVGSCRILRKPNRCHRWIPNGTTTPTVRRVLGIVFYFHVSAASSCRSATANASLVTVTFSVKSHLRNKTYRVNKARHGVLPFALAVVKDTHFTTNEWVGIARDPPRALEEMTCQAQMVGSHVLHAHVEQGVVVSGVQPRRCAVAGQCLITLIAGGKRAAKGDPTLAASGIKSGGAAKVALGKVVPATCVVVRTDGIPTLGSLGAGIDEAMSELEERALVSQRRQCRDVHVGGILTVRIGLLQKLAVGQC
mmetsp:Transcript_3168/g.7243  ORF Transcript_3168/g.7243 Transcript_3168/m.7243 type:complete len:259 (-) Transcript_3168:594-1370(-)